jgi:hypothetical protein
METVMHDLEPAAPGLTHGERLLLRALRLLALRTTCHSLKAQFEFACGCAGDEAYRALMVFVEQLRTTGRRRISLSAPLAPGVTEDERTLLEAFAAAQADAYEELDARLFDLTIAPPPASLGGAACLVAQVFALQGLLLAGGLPVADQDHPDQDCGPVRRCGRHHMAVPDRPGELQPLVHIEDHAR